MVDPEERVRRDAVRRVLGGDPVAKVARELARSEAWVRKWLERFDPAGDSWAVSASRAPRTSPGATEAELVALVLKVRSRLAENPWGQVGAAAIAWELSKLGVENPPPQRTIERILARAGTTRRTRREAGRRPPKGKDYPAPCAQAPNALQQIDWIGPRYLEGGQMLYVLNTVDLARHKVAREVMGAPSHLRPSSRRSLRSGGVSGYRCGPSSTTSRRSPARDCTSARWCASVSSKA